MSIDPLVSIVIPSYNHAQYISDAIDSILNQSYNNIELIVVDDGSTDSTRDILHKYESSIIYFYQDNAGQSKALEKGWSHSSGDILSYLSADDLLHPNSVEKAVDALMKNSNVSVVYSDFNLIDSFSRYIRTVRVGSTDFYNMFSMFHSPIGPGAFMRRSCYDDVGAWESKLHQMPDLDFWLRSSLFCNFLHLPFALASFRVHTNSQTFSSVSLERTEEPLIILRRILLLSRPLIDLDERLVKQSTSSAYLLISQFHIRSKRFTLGVKFLIKSVLIYPMLLLSTRFFRIIFNAFLNTFLHNALSKFRNLFGL